MDARGEVGVKALRQTLTDCQLERDNRVLGVGQQHLDQELWEGYWVHYDAILNVKHTLLVLARQEIRSCHSVSPSNVLRAFSMAAENCLYFASDLKSFSPLVRDSDIAL